MTKLNRWIATAALVPLLGLAAGCGGGDGTGDEADAYLLTDLDGGKVAVDPGSLPTPGAGATDPAASDAPSTEAPAKPPALTGRALVERVGAAISDVDSVHVSGGNENPPPVLESDHHFGAAGDDYDAMLSLGGQSTGVRRVGDTLYVDSGAGWQTVTPGAPEAAGAAAGLVPALQAWSPLGDLRSVLTGAGRVREEGPSDIDGMPVTSYTFRLDLVKVPRPSTLLPGTAPRTATVTLSLDADDRPVRLDLDLGDTVSRVGYADWGAATTIAVPLAT
ncbi:hypothetical protein BH11ACT8_BH11ACT8_32280 [soil metagenome]